MHGTATRRQILQGMGALAVGLASGSPLAALAGARVHAKRVISMQPRLYHGWPTLARRRNGELLLVCSGGRESHVCPFGRVELMRSRDEGRHWSFPRVLIDGPIDDRDAGVVETAEGSLLVTTFTSIGYADILARAEELESQGKGIWTREKLERWQAIHRRITAAEREIELGSWMIRSTDGGRSWSSPYRCPVNSPHGPIQLSDGRLLYAGKIFWYGPSGQSEGRIGVCESSDDGQSWRWLAEIPTRKGDGLDGYHELHAVEATDGTLIAHVRNHNTANERETLQSRSTDGGKTWSVPREIGVWGLPSHLLRLRDGRLVMSYGHRRPPYGNQARVSEDQGRTWSDAITISGDGISSDLGYPSTVELNDGSLLTAWYEVMDNPVPKAPPSQERVQRHLEMASRPDLAVLRQARWTLD